jgi:hypothetical protein
MSHQPMGVSGIDLDITTGLPRKHRTQEEQRAEVELKETQATREAAELLRDLPAVLHIMATQIENRLYELMRKDERCQGFLQILASFRMKIDIVPKVVAKIRRQAMGVTLTILTDETKVAPEGIPAEE